MACPVPVRLPFRKHKKLICLHMILMISDSIEAFPVDTVYQHLLVNRFQSLPIVICSRRVIADISNMKQGGKWIILYHVENQFRYHDSTFSPESVFHIR